LFATLPVKGHIQTRNLISPFEKERPMSDERLIEIETKLAHQEISIEELHDIVREQQKTIDLIVAGGLKQQRIRDAERAEGMDIGPANERPPHY
jgi:SlyX protein